MLSAPDRNEMLATDAITVAADPAVGWGAFGDVAFIGEMAVALLLSLVLAAALAYHPSSRRKASTLLEIEQPKTFIMYSMVAAVIAMIVRTQPNMALVVFGIGGLLRFRTDVGEAKDTGRVILVTVVGLCCGIQLYVVAVATTALGWVLVYLLERNNVGVLVVQVADLSDVAAMARLYGEALRASGCTVLGEQKRVIKGTVAYVYRAPPGVTRQTLEARFETLPNTDGATVDWQTA